MRVPAFNAMPDHAETQAFVLAHRVGQLVTVGRDGVLDATLLERRASRLVAQCECRHDSTNADDVVCYVGWGVRRAAMPATPRPNPTPRRGRRSVCRWLSSHAIERRRG